MVDDTANVIDPVWDAAVAAGVFVGAMLLFALDWRYGFAGSVTFVGAERVLAGDLPYRDFWTMYAPGHFYLNAAVRSVVGSHVIGLTIAASVAASACASGVYLLVRNFCGSRLGGLFCSSLFVAAMYGTGFFRYLGSYPTGIFFALAALSLIAMFYYSQRTVYLFAAGICVGFVLILKHDVGIYTGTAIAAGMLAYFMGVRTNTYGVGARTLLRDLGIFAAGGVIIALPVYVYFLAAAGEDMVRDLVVFPLTDFPYSRPEVYPSLVPRGIRGSTASRTLVNFLNYLSFALPFLAAVSGVAAAAIAFIRRRPPEFALTVTFMAAFLFHYRAAHVQINTHIISLSVYGGLIAVIGWKLFREESAIAERKLVSSAVAAAAVVWIASLAVPAAFTVRKKWAEADAVLTIPKVSGTRLPAEEAAEFESIWPIVQAEVPPGQPIYIGLNRHDTMLIGDTMSYFIFDRPSATRYQELHPAITDTAAAQAEMIRDIESKKVRLLVLRRVFDDESLDQFKRDFLVNLPNIGATDLDEYIRANFEKVHEFGSRSIWVRK